MTITCNFSSIATTISGLSVSGVTIRALDKIPQSGAMITPILFPASNFVSNLEVEVLTVGGHPTAAIDYTYQLNYVYLHCPAGSNISQMDVISGLMTNFIAIVAAIVGYNFTGKADVNFLSSQDPGVIEDPGGNQYWGVMFKLSVKEFAQ